MSWLLSLEKSRVYLQWAAEGDRHQYLPPNRGIWVKGGFWGWHCRGPHRGLLHWDGHGVGGCGVRHRQGHPDGSQIYEDSAHYEKLLKWYKLLNFPSLSTLCIYLLFMFRTASTKTLLIARAEGPFTLEIVRLGLYYLILIMSGSDAFPHPVSDLENIRKTLFQKSNPGVDLGFGSAPLIFILVLICLILLLSILVTLLCCLKPSDNNQTVISNKTRTTRGNQTKPCRTEDIKSPKKVEIL